MWFLRKAYYGHGPNFSNLGFFTAAAKLHFPSLQKWLLCRPGDGFQSCPLQAVKPFLGSHELGAKC